MGDHAMALILALARQLPAMSAALREGAWTRARRQANSGRRLSVQTLGLIGFGDSGVATARRARAFGMRVLATRRDRNASRDTADALGVEMVSLERLLAESDYVSLHLPLNKETYHLLDEGRLRQMKPGAYLINTARGEITDEIALAHLLREGHLAGAGIDTFEHINPFDEDARLARTRRHHQQHLPPRQCKLLPDAADGPLLVVAPCDFVLHLGHVDCFPLGAAKD